MNTVSSTDAKSNRSGSQQDTDTFSFSTRPPQQPASDSRTSGDSHHYSSSNNLPNDEYFINDETSTTSSSSFANPYYHPDPTSRGEEQYDGGDTQQQQPQHFKPQQQQQPRPHQEQQPLQDSVRDVNSLANSFRYQGRQVPSMQTQGNSTLRGGHLHSQPLQPQLLYQDHHSPFENQHHDQQYQPGGLRFDDPPQRVLQPPHRPHLFGREQQEAFDDDDDDDDLDDFIDQEPSRIQESTVPFQQNSNNTSNDLQRPPRPNSSHEVHSNNFITEEEFLMLADDYLLSLSPKKREKALLSNAMYQKILMVLLQPKNTQVSTAQFRFWAKKMFTLSTTETHHIVCHSGKPVATKECLYDVLVYCHRKSSHGGRDKTSAEVRQHYSWVPKELIARFVKHCPLCSSRRHSLQRSLSGIGLPGAGFELFVPSSGLEDRDDQHHFAASSDPFSGRSSQKGQYSMVEPGQADFDDNIYLHSPQDYRLPHLSSTMPTDRAQQQLQQGARLHSEHMMQLHHQRMQTEGSLGRYYDDRKPLRGHGHLRAMSGSAHDLAGTQVVSRGGGFTHPESSGLGPPGDRIEGLQSNFHDGSRRQGWGRDSRVDIDKGQDVEMLGDGSDYGRGDGGGGASRMSSQGGNEPPQSRGGYVSNAIEKAKDDDCTPSGLVGIPQEVRGGGSTGVIRRKSQSTAYNRLYLQQQQQQQGIVQSSSSSQAMSPSALSQNPGGHPNRASGHNRLAMGYPYGYPYPYNPAVGSSSMGYGPIKQVHGAFQVPSQQQLLQQQQQQLQQHRQSSLSHSTSTTFPQIVSESLGIFQEMGEYVSEEDHRPGNQALLMGGEDNGGDGQGQGPGMNPHGPSS